MHLISNRFFQFEFQIENGRFLVKVYYDLKLNNNTPDPNKNKNKNKDKNKEKGEGRKVFDGAEKHAQELAE